jgi:AmiR/NasT family two-component response regulator
MDDAFRQLRAYARSRKRRLTDVATEIISGALSLDDLVEPSSDTDHAP